VREKQLPGTFPLGHGPKPLPRSFQRRTPRLESVEQDKVHRCARCHRPTRMPHTDIARCAPAASQTYSILYTRGRSRILK